MPPKLILLAMAVSAAPCAFAQDRSAAPITTYLLVDGSASMSKGVNWADALDIVAQHLAILKRQPSGSSVSISQITSDPELKCETPVSLAPLQPAQTASWTPAAPAGSTLLGRALEVVISTAGTSEANIIIVTDGSQTCGPNICDVAKAMLPTRHNLKVEVAFTEDGTPEDKDQLRCIAAAHAQANKAADEAAEVEKDDTGVEPFAAAAMLWWLSLGLLVVSAGVFSFHYAGAAAKVEHKIRTLASTKKDDSGGGQ